MALAIQVCEDCYYVWANGNLPDERTEGARPPWQLWQDVSQYRTSCDSGEPHFSRAYCDACGCTWAGWRYPMTLVRTRNAVNSH